MKRINLSGKYGEGKFAVVDDEDYDYLSKFSWRLDREEYVIRGVRTSKGYSRIALHREVMQVSDPKYHVDHINHDKLDNRKENLRICTHHQNIMNRKSTKCATSKFKGVHWDKHSNKWRSMIRLNQKNISLGRFDDELEAAKAYNRKASELFGDFAFLNEVE